MAACLMAAPGGAQTARQVRGAAAVEPIANEPAGMIVVDPPLAEPLSRGLVVIQYRTENLHIAPVFGPTPAASPQIVPVYGPAALAVSPRVGHIHVTVDDATWHWADAGGNPVIINGLLPGPHKVLIQLVNADHQPIDEGTVRLTIPQRSQ